MPKTARVENKDGRAARLVDSHPILGSFFCFPIIGDGLAIVKSHVVRWESLEEALHQRLVREAFDLSACRIASASGPPGMGVT